MPISDGVKRRLYQNIKEISRLKDELESCQDEKDSFEKEFEMLEDEIESIRGENERVENELNQKVAVVNALEKKLDRNQKDFDNFRKRNQSDVERQIKMGSKKIILGIIDVIDNFDRALMEARKNDWRSGVKQIVDGVESTEKGWMTILEESGFELVDP
jgi:molecular chaperone GrpE